MLYEQQCATVAYCCSYSVYINTLTLIIFVNIIYLLYLLSIYSFILFNFSLLQGYNGTIFAYGQVSIT